LVILTPSPTSDPAFHLQSLGSCAVEQLSYPDKAFVIKEIVLHLSSAETSCWHTTAMQMPQDIAAENAML